MTKPAYASGSKSVQSFSTSLGRAIKAERMQRGWSRRQLAERAGISYSYATHIENGRRPPSSPVLLRIAESLGLLPSDLLSRAEKEAGAGRVPETVAAGGSAAMLGELAELIDRMSPGDRERLLDLARRLAH